MRIPGWFKALFVVMMLIVCGTVTWWAVTQYDLHTQAAELALKLDTSRQRERKQQVEYDEVVAALLEAVRALFAEATAVPGVGEVQVIPNVIPRPNRYDLMIVLTLSREGLAAFDASPVHARWKAEFGALIAQKTIFVCE